MAVPIVRQGRLLIASLPLDATDHQLSELLTDLAEQEGETAHAGSWSTSARRTCSTRLRIRILETIGQVTQLRGATTAIVGVQPGVARAMVQLGVRVEGVQTAMDLEDAMHILYQEAGVDGRDDR